MSKNNFGIIATIGLIVVIILVVFVMAITSQNKAINLEEQINESGSSIEVQEKRRVDLIQNLVDIVEAYSDYEGETLQKVTEARTQASKGNIEEAQLAIQAVAEAYPTLKADEHYSNLMLELATTENLIAEHRNNYNLQVKAYNKHIRTFPNSFLLNIMGYDKIDVDYLEYEAPSDAPTNLFEKQ